MNPMMLHRLRELNKKFLNMRRILSIVLYLTCVSIPLDLCAQSALWNLDFEEWDLNDTTPGLWHDTTVIENRLGLFPPKWHYRPDFIPEGTGLGRTTDATTGEYAVTLSGFYSYEVMRIISGNNASEAGWPISIKPKKFLGDYKSILLGSCDSLRTYVDVHLTKFDDVNQVRDTIGYGHVILNETSDAYQSFEFAINYDNNSSMPDTVIVVLAKQRFGFDSPPACLECSHVFFDNLRFENTVSTVNQNDQMEDVQLVPNPIHDYFMIKSNCGNCLWNVNMFTANGQLVKTYNDIKSDESMFTNHLNKGLYFLRIKENGTNKIVFKKLVLQ